MDEKLPTLSRNAELFVTLVMLQKNDHFLNGETTGINGRVLIRKYLEHGQVWLFFQSTT